MLKSKKLISIVVISLFIFPVLFASVPIVPTVKATGQITQIGLCIDGSGSISSSNWNTIKSGIADAVQNTLPHDGSIELTIVQFGGTIARVELYPTIITDTNVGSVVATINAMTKIGGTTPMAAGLSLTWNTMRSSQNFQNAKKQIINIVTDGNPNIPSPSSNARSQVISARNTAVFQGLDELDAEAIGTNPDVNWLRDYVVYPPLTGGGNIATLVYPSSFIPGWVLPISSFADFPVAIRTKFEILSPPIPPTEDKVIDLLNAIEAKLDFGGSFYNFVNNWFKEIEGKLWSWENSVKNDTMAIWTLTNNIHGWANLTVALDDIKSEIEGIETDISSLLTTNYFNEVIGDLSGSVHGWTTIVGALNDIKNEIEGISTVSSGTTIKSSSTGSVSVTEETNKIITITCDRAYQVKAIYINMTSDADINVPVNTLKATIGGIDYEMKNGQYSPKQNEKFEYIAQTGIEVYPALPANGALKIPIEVKKSGYISVLVVVETTQDATVSVTIS